MIPYIVALQKLEEYAKCTVFPNESVFLIDSVNRICAENIKAQLAIQPFDNSAMDGYAVRLSDFENLSVTLNVVETIAAGDVPQMTCATNKACAAIMTGAMMPAWADAVVPVEKATRDGSHVTFSSKPEAGDHIRCKGQDFSQGDTVLKNGTVLMPSHVMPLATLGITKISVFKKLKTCFLATGKELVSSDLSVLPPAKIYNSNMPYALAVMESMNLDCAMSATIQDDAEKFSTKVEEALQAGCGLILSSGAVSAGAFDFVRGTLEKMGAKILFHKVAIKPGKPVLFAQFPNGTFYFGLPGNPTATAAALRFFLQPFLDACFGLPNERSIYASLVHSFEKKNDLRLFLKAHVTADKAGKMHVTLLDGQESFMTKPFLAMNAWAVIPERSGQYGAGTMLEIYSLQRHAGIAF